MISVSIVTSILALSSISAFGDTSTSQGYKSKSELLSGSVVSISKDDDGYVEAATSKNRKQLVGVVVGLRDTTLSFGGGDNKVQVASAGNVPTLVSDINGEVKAGDPLSISPIAGTVMRATTRGKIIGTAEKDFSSVKGDKKTQVTVTDTKGVKKTVNVVLLNVHINVQDWSPNGVQANAFLDSTREFISNVAGRPVTNVQAFASLAIAILAIIISAVILYSSVSSSVISIGRNPLSKGIIRRNLFYMMGVMSLIIAGAGMSIYLILKG